MNEPKLKDFLRELMIWTDVSSKPAINKLLLKKLDDAFDKQDKGSKK